MNATRKPVYEIKRERHKQSGAGTVFLLTLKINKMKTLKVQELRIVGGKKLQSALEKDGWIFSKDGNHFKAESPSGHFEFNRKKSDLLLNCSWHPMYQNN
jgi:hypothetical protein